VVEVLIVVGAILLGWALTGLLVRAFVLPRHLATPNARSMHKAPVPTGAGLAIVACVGLFWPLVSWPLAAETLLGLAAVALLALVSYIDDRRPLWPVTRLFVQAVAVGAVLSELPEHTRVAAELPLAVERGLITLAWLWLINLTNFMDGIDGLAASEAAAVALGYVAVVHAAGLPATLVPLALILAGACLGFLVWNWHPARIFMGDVGSITVGFMLGWLMFDLATHGQVAAALILPLVFVADATLTLLRRLAEGHRPSQAHKTHYYQRAAEGAAGVPRVVLATSLANVALIGLAIVSVKVPLGAALAAAGVAFFLLRWLSASAAGGHAPSDIGRARKA
jgi:UDP-N-acetylmuramyl pentapeptide phosphotransferase/UDP-N-acetylglucosamine-1-phosphate transferase